MKYPLPRTNVLQAFETATHKFKNLRYCNRCRAAKKKKLCYIACLIQSLIFRLSRMAAAAGAAYTAYRRAKEKNTFCLFILHQIFFFIITLFFSLVIVSMGPGCLRLTFSVSHTSFFQHILFGVLDGWRCSCLVVSCRCRRSYHFARWIHFNVTLHIHYFDKDQTRRSVSRSYNLSGYMRLFI